MGGRGWERLDTGTSGISMQVHHLGRGLHGGLIGLALLGGLGVGSLALALGLSLLMVRVRFRVGVGVGVGVRVRVGVRAMVRGTSASSGGLERRRAAASAAGGRVLENSLTRRAG